MRRGDLDEGAERACGAAGDRLVHNLRNRSVQTTGPGFRDA